MHAAAASVASPLKHQTWRGMPFGQVAGLLGAHPGTRGAMTKIAPLRTKAWTLLWTQAPLIRTAQVRSVACAIATAAGRPC